MKTNEVVARVYCFVSLKGMGGSREFYKTTSLDPDNCMQREREVSNVTPHTREVYATAMGLTVEQFDLPLPDFLTTLKTHLEAHSAHEETTR